MTHLYIGRKIVTAWRADRPQQVNGVQTLKVEEGYSVKYEDGYISWSPRAVFEAAYILVDDVDGLQPHEIRVAAEYAALRRDYERLTAFLQSPDTLETLAVSDEHLELLNRQVSCQGALLKVLDQRLGKFKREAIVAGRRLNIALDPDEPNPGTVVELLVEAAKEGSDTTQGQ
jgi:hypothetical protein